MNANWYQKVTATLRAQGGAMVYHYDYTRLNRIMYPQHPENNVTYTYGAPGASNHRANRVVTVTDESGKEERFYGRLGEVVKTLKTVASETGKTPEVYTTLFEYDTWNRLQKLTYPDGEVLTYRYDSGGLLRAISGTKSGQNYAYLNRLEYDQFDQRTFVEYGNKTRTHYRYNEYNRRLAGLKAGVGAGQGKLFQDLTYDYDNVGNILGQANHAATKSPKEMGGATQFKYQYDDLYRLVHAEGNFDTQPDKRHTYRLDMQYDSIHNILLKDQLHELKEPKTTVLVQKPTTYKFDYQYAGQQPHAPTHIGPRTYTYDANGNQTGWTNDPDGTRRVIEWDEENRIQRIVDNGSEKTYKYNDAGERVIKVSKQGETVYVNQFFVIRNKSVATKHVFAGSSRLVSKLAKQENLTIAAQNSGTVLLEDGPNEHQMYFYHPDHLGSSSYVTDKRGKVFQHLEYFPFGETWVEESSTTQRTPYLFTAKELDEDTGLYYFGARYYDARVSVWASVDPILDSYLGGKAGMGGVFNTTNLNLYHYAGLNPVKHVDPDGKQVYTPMTQAPRPPPLETSTNVLGETIVTPSSRSGRSIYYGSNVIEQNYDTEIDFVRLWLDTMEGERQNKVEQQIASSFPKGTSIQGYIFYRPTPIWEDYKDIGFTAIHRVPKCETTCMEATPVVPSVMMPSDMKMTGLVTIRGTGNSFNTNRKTQTVLDGQTWKELNTKQLIEHGFLRDQEGRKIELRVEGTITETPEE